MRSFTPITCQLSVTLPCFTPPSCGRNLGFIGLLLVLSGWMFAGDVAPSISLMNTDLNWTENAAGVTLFPPGSTVDDPDSDIKSIAITITQNSNANDVIEGGSFTKTNPGGLPTWTYSTQGTPGEYSTLINALTFRNTSENPGGLVRTVRVAVTDATDKSVSVTATIAVTVVDTAPTVSAMKAGISWTENAAGVTLFPSGSTVVDPDSDIKSIAITITANSNANDVIEGGSFSKTNPGKDNNAGQALLFSFFRSTPPERRTPSSRLGFCARMVTSSQGGKESDCPGI